MTTDEQRISDILADTSRHIEFHGFLTNHLKHAAIALSGLGANTDFVERYTNNYAKTTYGFGLEAAKPSTLVVTDRDWPELYGKHENFSSMVRFLLARADDMGVDNVIRQYVPDLISGCVGSLLHGMIHLGWAIHSGNNAMILEGIAYFAFSYVSCHPHRISHKRNDTNAVDSLLRITSEWETYPEIADWVDELVAQEPTAQQSVLKGTGAQLKIAQVLDARHDILDEDVAWLRAATLPEIWSQLEKVVVLLYLAEPGNFVVLHLVTGLFGMEHIAASLSEDDARQAARCFWKMVIGVLLALKAFPSSKRLNLVLGKFDEPKDEPDNVKEKWNQIIKRAMADPEEHNAKMVYVLQKWWRKHLFNPAFREAAVTFTITPLIS